MRYRNRNTGAVIDVVSKVSGAEWEPLTAPAPVPAPAPAPEVAKDKNRKRKKKVAGNE